MADRIRYVSRVQFPVKLNKNPEAYMLIVTSFMVDFYAKVLRHSSRADFYSKILWQNFIAK